MKYIYGTKEVTQYKSSVVVLGNFDGVHLGHQKLFEVARREASYHHLQVIALSFYPHPTWVLGSNPKALIMSRRDRKEKIKSIGIDVFIEYPFSKQFAVIEPETFFKTILVDQLKAKAVVIGTNYFFGCNKKGDVAYMEQLGEKYGIEICAVDTIKEEELVVSSTYIRQLIVQGDMKRAALLLGAPYSIIGTVVHGKKLGRTLGFPTINIIADTERVYPPNGVYATTVTVHGNVYKGITNVGYNPTVEGKVKMIETHIFDFDEVIYGVEVKVAFHQFIRTEQRFGSIDALKEQLIEDKSVGKSILKKH
ncbi:MAG: bifunctional riboflavin kinase/FAD synthetase [Cellulosilyticaceae bacterium]